jgi:hypothetical protein
MNSTFANLPGHRKMEARTSQRIEMHPPTRRRAALRRRARARLQRPRLAELTAMLNASLPAGVVAARLDWAKLHPDGDEHQRADQRAAHRHRRRSDVLLDAG